MTLFIKGQILALAITTISTFLNLGSVFREGTVAFLIMVTVN